MLSNLKIRNLILCASYKRDHPKTELQNTFSQHWHLNWYYRCYSQLKIRADSRQIFGREGRDRVVEADLPFSRQIQPRTWKISRPPTDGRLISPDLGRISTEISHLGGVAYIYIYTYVYVDSTIILQGPAKIPLQL